MMWDVLTGRALAQERAAQARAARRLDRVLRTMRGAPARS